MPFLFPLNSFFIAIYINSGLKNAISCMLNFVIRFGENRVTLDNVLKENYSSYISFNCSNAIIGNDFVQFFFLCCFSTLIRFTHIYINAMKYKFNGLIKNL